MKAPSKSLALIALSGAIVLTFVLAYLQVLWADWAIQTIFHKDFHGLAIFGAICIIELLCPKPLSGLSTILLILMTLYIFLV